MKLIIKTAKILGLTTVLIMFQSLISAPWWTFLVLVFLIGLATSKKFWNNQSFLNGFLAGFLSWSVPLLYFSSTYDGDITQILSELIAVPFVLLVPIIGLIGGILVGLALLSGTQLRVGREENKLEL